MCPSPLTVVSVRYHYDNPTKRVVLVQSGHHHYFIEYNLFSPWYSWKLLILALNNNHSLDNFNKINNVKWLSFDKIQIRESSRLLNTLKGIGFCLPLIESDMYVSDGSVLKGQLSNTSTKKRTGERFFSVYNTFRNIISYQSEITIEIYSFLCWWKFIWWIMS